MHDFNDATILPKEVKAWGMLRQLIFGVVLQDFVDLEAKRKHNFFLFAKL